MTTVLRMPTQDLEVLRVVVVPVMVDVMHEFVAAKPPAVYPFGGKAVLVRVLLLAGHPAHPVAVAFDNEVAVLITFTDPSNAWRHSRA